MIDVMGRERFAAHGQNHRLLPGLGLIVAIQAAHLAVFIFLYILTGGAVFFFLPEWAGPLGVAALAALVAGGSQLVRQPITGSALTGGGLTGAAVVFALFYRPNGSGTGLYSLGTIALSIVGLAMLIWRARQARFGPTR